MVVERDFATNQNIEHNTETPDINLRPGISTSLQKLGSSEIKTATEGLEMTFGREEVAQTKVNDFDIARLADEDVLDLQVSVNNTVPMTVVQSAGYLPAELASLLLLQLAVGDDVVEHLATVDILEEHVPMIIGAYHIT